MKDKVNEIIKRINPELLDRDLSGTDNLVEDLSFDSLTYYALISSLEEEFSIIISNHHIHRFQCLNDVYSFIQNDKT